MPLAEKGTLLLTERGPFLGAGWATDWTPRPGSPSISIIGAAGGGRSEQIFNLICSPDSTHHVMSHTFRP